MAAADPHGNPNRPDRSTRHHNPRLPPHRLRPRCRRPWERSGPSWAIILHTCPMKWVCGGTVGSALSSVREKGQARRCERSSRGLQACSRRPSPQAGSRGQGTAAYPCPTIEKIVQLLLVQLESPQDGAHGRTLKIAELHPLGRNVQLTRVCFCDGDRCEGR